MTNDETVDLDDLARRASAGDQMALNQLLAAVQPRVMRLCSRILPVRLIGCAGGRLGKTKAELAWRAQERE